MDILSRYIKLEGVKISVIILKNPALDGDRYWHGKLHALGALSNLCSLSVKLNNNEIRLFTDVVKILPLCQSIKSMYMKVYSCNEHEERISNIFC